MMHLNPTQRPSVVEALEKCRHLRNALHPVIRFSPEDEYPDMEKLRTITGVQTANADFPLAR